MTEALTFREHSKKDANELIHYSDHCFLITSELRELFLKIFSKLWTPLDNTYSHLEEDVSQMGVTLLDNRVGTRELNNFLPAIKSSNISQLCHEPTGELKRDTDRVLGDGDDILGMERWVSSPHVTKLDTFLHLCNASLSYEGSGKDIKLPFSREEPNRRYIFTQEDKKRNMEPSRRFHHNHKVGIRRDRVKCLTEGRKAFPGIRKRTFLDNTTTFRFNNAKVERVFRDINSNVKHGTTPIRSVFRLSLISILPSRGGFLAQPTYWELRDRGTNSFGGFVAYKLWSPCPSHLLNNIN